MPIHSSLGASQSFQLVNFEMQDHIRHYSKEMWKIVVNGFNLVDHDNLTPHEAYDDQLNDFTCMLIRKGLSNGIKEPYFHIKFTMELCDRILLSKTGISTLQL